MLRWDSWYSVRYRGLVCIFTTSPLLFQASENVKAVSFHQGKVKYIYHSSPPPFFSSVRFFPSVTSIPSGRIFCDDTEATPTFDTQRGAISNKGREKGCHVWQKFVRLAILILLTKNNSNYKVTFKCISCSVFLFDLKQKQPMFKWQF